MILTIIIVLLPLLQVLLPLIDEQSAEADWFRLGTLDQGLPVADVQYLMIVLIRSNLHFLTRFARFVRRVVGINAWCMKGNDSCSPVSSAEVISVCRHSFCSKFPAQPSGAAAAVRHEHWCFSGQKSVSSCTAEVDNPQPGRGGADRGVSVEGEVV